jgi:hypothetical protein
MSLSDRRSRYLAKTRIAWIAALGIFTQGHAEAAPQEATAAQEPVAAAAADDDGGQDFTRPKNLFQLRYIYETAPGAGIIPGTTREVTSDIVKLRADLKFEFASQWTLALRGDLPIVAKDPITSDNPTGNYLYGIGDGDFQAVLIKKLDARWAAGFGARIVAPTGVDNLSSGEWQVLPMIGVRYMLPELSAGSYFTALFRYDKSFAGDPSKKNISNLQFAPTLNIGLPDRWFLAFYPSPDIRLNYGDPTSGQTGRLFLPLDIMVGRSVAKNAAISLEVSVPMIKDYPVYDFKTVARINMKF